MLAGKRSREPCVILDAFQNLGTFGIDVITQESRVHTRISSHLLFVERLDKLQGHVGRIAELLVAFHLQGSQVEQAGRCFRSFLGGDVRDGERSILNALQQFLTGFPVGNGRNSPVGILFGSRFLAGSRVLFFLCCFFSQFFITLADDGGKERIAVKGFQFPVLFRNKILDFFLAVDDEGQCRSLYASDGKHLLVLSVFQGIQAGCIHAQGPVADGPAQSGLIQRLEFLLVFQVGKAFADGFFRQGRNPQALDRAFGSGFLHHPPLDQFSFLSGIPAVDDHFGLSHQAFDDMELFLDTRIVNQFDTEAGRNHRKAAETP